MNKILVICGPTATGKTALGLKLAKKFNGDLISADSRQVYKGMNSLTGKGIPPNSKFVISDDKLGYWETKDEIKIWMQDLIGLTDDFSVAQWRKIYWSIVNKLWKYNKLPITVGLSGFYLDSITKNIETIDIPQDKNLRVLLSQKTVQELFDLLSQMDPIKSAQMNNSDRKNPRRLLRAIEVAKYKAETDMSSDKDENPQTDFLFIGLNAPSNILNKRIDESIDERLKQGAIEEASELLSLKISEDLPALQTHGFKNLSKYLKGEVTPQEAIKMWKIGEHQDAKKQYAKLKTNKHINWFDITENDWEEKVEKLVKSWYN